jgi:HemX protein
MTGFLHLGSLGLYGIAAALLGVSFVRGDRRLPRFASVALMAALALHVWALAAFWSRWGAPPLAGLGPVFFTLALLLGVGSLVAATLGHAGTVGLVLIPVVALMMGVAILVGIEPVGEPLAYQGVGFVLHVVFAIVGYVGLTIAFAAGLMYLLQFRELKGKHFGAIFRFFPPLETLDRLGRRGLLVGFPSLTAALALAWVWTLSARGPFAVGDPHLVWSAVTWLVFVAALLSRYGGGRRAYRGALVSVIGFAVVVVVYVLLRVQLSRGGVFL